MAGGAYLESHPLWLQTLMPLAADYTVELQGTFRDQDGYFAANGTTF